MIALNRALYEVWSLCGAQICSKFFSLLLHKNTKNSSMHVCNGCWAEIEDHAYITRCGHQFCASSFLFCTTVYALLKFFCFSSLVLSSFCRSLSLSLLLLLLTHILLLNRDAFYSRKQTTGEEDIQRVLSSGECPICQKAVLERHVKQTPLVLERRKFRYKTCLFFFFFVFFVFFFFKILTCGRQ